MTQGGTAVPLQSLRVASDSGLDYRYAAAVPEPTPALSLLLGLLTGLLSPACRHRLRGHGPAGS